MPQLCLIHLGGNVSLRLGRDPVFGIRLLRIETLPVETRASTSGVRQRGWQIKGGIEAQL